MDAKKGIEDRGHAFRNLTSLLDHASWGVAVISSEAGRLEYMNTVFDRMHDYRGGALLNTPFSDLLAPDYRQEYHSQLDKIPLSGHITFESMNLRRDGSRFPAEMEISAVRDDDGAISHFLIHVEDMTGRIEGEEVLKEMADRVALKSGREFYESLVLFICDTMGTDYAFIGRLQGGEKVRTVSVSAGGEIVENFDYYLSGTPCENVVGKEACFYPSGIQELFPEDTMLSDMGVVSYSGIPVFASDGSALGLIATLGRRPLKPRDHERLVSLLKIFAGRVSYELERERTEAIIRKNLEEKDVLLREVHHRVKNNLALIVSLLRLQARSTSEEGAAEALTDSQCRVRSMALIHEKLYQSEHLALIEADRYIRDLAAELFTIYGRDSRLIRLEYDLEKVHMELDTLIPLGIIINELVTNSLKHAWPEKAKEGGRITLTLRVLPDGEGLVEVKDDGKGIPAGLDLERPAGLGLSLVRTLVDQLGGSLAVREALEGGGGTVFSLRFPHCSPSAPASEA